jgi:hypothetical protein
LKFKFKMDAQSDKEQDSAGEQQEVIIREDNQP